MADGRVGVLAGLAFGSEKGGFVEACRLLWNTRRLRTIRRPYQKFGFGRLGMAKSPFCTTKPPGQADRDGIWKPMRYSEHQVSSELLDQPAFAGAPRKLFICSTPRSGSYLLCRYMINAGLGVPHEYFNPIIMRQIAPRFGLGDDVAPLKWRRATGGTACRSASRREPRR